MGHILVIEDDPGTQVLLRGRLHELGHEVVMAGTGAMGLMEARAQSFDLFIVDIHLGSGIDGYEVCRRVKAIPQMRSIPVVLLSGQVSTREELHRGYEAGCEAFLMKGDSNLLEDTVRVMLRIKSLQDELAYQNQLLAQQARVEGPEGSAGPAGRLGAALESEEAREVVYRELGHGRPDGVLLADADGVCRFADRGARDLLGKDLEGRHLGSVVPASRLEAYVRDAKSARHEGYGLDLALRKGGVERHLSATVVPLAPRPGEPTRPMRVVLLQDASRRRVAADLLRLGEPVPRREIGPLLEAARNTYRPSALLGASPLLVELRAVLERESKTRAPVWIHGEPGTGRNTAARILHFAGFQSGSLVPLDCRAIAPASAESELFGQVAAKGKGKEKGAESARPGAFQLAHLGTLLLYEPETLEPGVQDRIAAALSEGKVRRVGSRKAESAEVRLVLVTGPAAADGSSGLVPALADLVGCTLAMPPLRERPGDVTLLARHLLQGLTREGQPCDLSEEALWVLEQHDWPGNVRELASSLERAVEKAGSSMLTGKDLPRPLADLYRRYEERNQIPALPPRARASGEVVPARPPAGLAPLGNPLEEEPVSLELYEKHCLQRALRETGGDKLAAARLLKVGKSTLYRKLKRYGIT